MTHTVTLAVYTAILTAAVLTAYGALTESPQFYIVAGASASIGLATLLIEYVRSTWNRDQDWYDQAYDEMFGGDDDAEA